MDSSVPCLGPSFQEVDPAADPSFPPEIAEMPASLGPRAVMQPVAAAAAAVDGLGLGYYCYWLGQDD